MSFVGRTNSTVVVDQIGRPHQLARWR